MSEGMRDVPTDNVGRKIADEIETDSFGVSNRDATARKINAALSSSQARLSEAVKVLEPFARLMDWPLNGMSDERSVHCRVYPDGSGPNPAHFEAGFGMSVGEFRAAKAFLATLGEET